MHESIGNSGQHFLPVLPGDSHQLHPKLVPGTRHNSDTCIEALTQAEASRKHLSSEGNWLLGSEIQERQLQNELSSEEDG